MTKYKLKSIKIKEKSNSQFPVRIQMLNCELCLAFSVSFHSDIFLWKKTHPLGLHSRFIIMCELDFTYITDPF